VSAFDGWGRAACAAFSAHATDANKAKKLSFQNLNRAKARVQQLFGYALEDSLVPGEFESAHCNGPRRSRGFGTIRSALSS